MKKYMCPNCGFKTRFETTKDGRKRTCDVCKAQVFNSKKVFEQNMMAISRYGRTL